MSTLYLNMKTAQGVETVDEFTLGEDAPKEWRLFIKYVKEMIAEYHMAGMGVYRSRCSTKEWRS